MNLIAEKIKSITVVKLDHIGDAILATPAIESLRTGFPQAKIRVVVGSWSEDVLANNPNVDEVICYDPPWLDRSLNDRMSGRREENRETMKLLLDTEHDLTVDLRRNDFNHIAFSASLASEHLLAYKTKSKFDHLITHGVSVTSYLRAITVPRKSCVHPPNFAQTVVLSAAPTVCSGSAGKWANTG